MSLTDTYLYSPESTHYFLQDFDSYRHQRVAPLNDFS